MKYYRKVNRLIAELLLSAIALGACTKGVPVTEQSYAKFEFKAVTIEPFTYRVWINGELVANNLYGPDGVADTAIFFDNNQLHVRMESTPGNTTVLDTVYAAKIASTNYFTLYQRTYGDAPFYVHPGKNEPLPAEGYVKLQFVYSDASFPDSMRLVLENINHVKDSAVLYRNNFSKWINWRKDEIIALSATVYHAAESTTIGSLNLSPGDMDPYNPTIFQLQPGFNTVLLNRLY